MKVLLVNKYFYKKAGAELVFFDTAELLKKNGHQLMFFSMKHPRNESTEYEPFFTEQVDYDRMNFRSAWRASVNLLYSRPAQRNLDRLLALEKPDIAHLHNIYHQLSPSILRSLKKAGIPVVMTLHDYKLVCASYSMISQGRICESCKGGKYQNCFIRACVKGSRLKSLLGSVEMFLHHDLLKLYDLVDRYIAPSRFLAQKLGEMGFGNPVEYVPNFVDKDESQTQVPADGRTIVYFGRLSKEKGVLTLLDAVQGLDVTLNIIGEGPAKEALLQSVADRKMSNVRFLGYLTGEALRKAVGSARFAVVPSEWYENNPRAVLEAFALGKPVIGANVGGIPELVRDGETGLLFRMGDAADLRNKISGLMEDPEKIDRMGAAAKSLAQNEFGPARHYERLMGVYASVLGNR